MEDTPGLERRLREHLSLDFAVDLSCILLDVEGGWVATGAGSHEEVSSLVLVAREFRRILVELQVPQLLLLLALRVLLEVLHKVLDLLNLRIGVGVQDLSKVFHKMEVCSHGISQSCQLAELGNQSDFVSSASVLVDEEWLVLILDGLVVASLVILHVAGRSTILVEGGSWTLTKVYPVDLVGLLVVPCDHSRTGESITDRLLAVSASLLGFVSNLVHSRKS